LPPVRLRRKEHYISVLIADLDYGGSTPYSSDTLFMIIGCDTNGSGEMKTNETGDIIGIVIDKWLIPDSLLSVRN
jgi:hypothetical protein